jgi:hypothetical protein
LAVNRAKRQEFKGFLEKARDLVWSLPDPWARAEGPGRTPDYMARPLVVLCVAKVYVNKSSRWVEGFLDASDWMCGLPGFRQRIPSYETIRRAVVELGEEYIRGLNRKLLERMGKN